MALAAPRQGRMVRRQALPEDRDGAPEERRGRGVAAGGPVEPGEVVGHAGFDRTRAGARRAHQPGLAGGGPAATVARAMASGRGRAIAPHCPFLMQVSLAVLTSPGGQASRWLEVLFELPLAPAPVVLPRSPLVLPPATPVEGLRPVAPVPVVAPPWPALLLPAPPWPALLLPAPPWPALLLPAPPWPAANALPERPRLRPVTPAVPARPSARQETPAMRDLRMDILRSRTRTAERMPT